ncbi:MAG: prepilin peptidase [Pseudomonadota bacterium]
MNAELAPLALLLAALPFCIWATVTDLREMKILNTCNMGLFLAFVAIGAVIFPLDVYALRLAQGALMLVVGILLNATGHVGGGDSKFIAAMAPFIALQDATVFLMLLAATSLITVGLHRGVGAISPLQPALAGWKSWQVGSKFPFGVTLSAALMAYLALGL